MQPTRAAGLLYLLLAITGFPSLILIPRALIVPGDAAATAERIRASEPLFRLGIAGELISATIFIFVALALYQLFKRIDQGQATLMVILVLVSVPISFVNVLNEMAVLTLLNAADLRSVFGEAQLDSLAMAFLRVHIQGFAIASIFWGLWLLPLAALVMRPGLAPRVVGVLLILAGAAYVVASFASLLLPQYASLVASVAMIPEAGEFAVIVWLLVTRARPISLARAEVAAPS